jgi:hypothetical protein
MEPVSTELLFSNAEHAEFPAQAYSVHSRPVSGAASGDAD